jgi:hypothetical protein
MDYKNKRKKIRNILIEKCISDLRKTKLPDYTLGFLLKSIHFHTPWYFLILFIFLPKPLAILAMVPLFIAFFTFIYLQGCFLTIVERKLLKDDDKINIIDPYIQLIGDEVNETTQFWYTLAISALYCILVIVLLYCRGCFKWSEFQKFNLSFLFGYE